MIKIKAIMLAAMVTGNLAACAQSEKNIVATEPLNAQQLGNYEWYVREATDAQGRTLADFSKNPNVKLQFNNGFLTVSGGCNNFAAPYQLDSRDMTLTLVGAVAGTLMSCTPELMAQDTAIERFLNEIKFRWVKNNDNQPKLWIENQQGDHLILIGVQSTASKYGQPTTVFWEINNKTRACKSAQGKKECLQVRDVTYDEGIKSSTGEWRIFDGKIEGWHFNPKEKQVLRLKVYQKKSANSREENFIYQLDQIIERSLVK